MILAPAQQKAVERTGQDVCVVAGPGSGKTRVLVERFGWLVKQHHVAPLRILAITFTEKAATEIKQRLINAFSDDETTRAQIERAYVSTIHGFCARLLREYSVAAGVDPEFAVLDEPESALALTEVTHAVLEKLYQERPAEFQRLLEATQFSNDLADCLMSAYQARRVTGATLDRTDPTTLDTDAIREVVREVEAMLEQVPSAGSDAQRRRVEKLRGWLVEARALEGAPLSAEYFRVLSDFGCDLRGLRNGNLLHDVVGDLRDNRVPAILAALAGTYYASSRGLLVDALERIDEAYQSRKRELSALDFSDLEERAIELLEGNPEALRSVRGNFDYVLMDELQDTNPLQWRIVNLIRSPGRFFAVGDINQSIYGFRNAAPGAFQDYRRDVENAGHEVDELDENYRSRAQVLAAAEYILRGAEGIEARTLTARRAFPEKPEPCVEIIAARGEDSEAGRELEAQWIARRIRELEGTLKVGSGEKEHTARFRDFAILVRTSKALEPIEHALKKFHVPYLTTGGRTFYEAREVRDLTLLLRVIANPRDEIALAGVLRSPLAGVCDETLLRMKSGGGLTRALQASALGEHEDYDAAELERLRRFRELLASLRGVRDDISPDRLLLRAIDASGYEERLDARARANVDKLLGIIRGWWSTRRGTVDELVANLAWRREAAPETDAPPDDSSDTVRVMSIHQAKGLEFPIVFLAALDRGTSQSGPPLALTSNGRLGVRWRHPAGNGYLDDSIRVECAEQTKTRESEEENRLLYVAMTRAEEHLVLSFSHHQRSAQPAKRVIGSLALDCEATGAGPVAQEFNEGRFSARLLRPGAEPELVPAPVREEHAIEEEVITPWAHAMDQHDSSASATDIAAFERCPRCYFLERYAGWGATGWTAYGGNGDTPGDSDGHAEMSASEFGTQVHELLAGAAVESPDAEALELKARFKRSALGRRVADASRAEREFGLLFAVEDVVLRGQIDLWFEESGRVVLVDYKTDGIEAAQAEARGEEHALQLRLYALGVGRLEGRMPDEAFVYFLRPDVAVPVDLSEASMEAARESVRRFKDAQSTLCFPPREGGHCRHCRFRARQCSAGVDGPV